jgi:hypothetical protein
MRVGTLLGMAVALAACADSPAAPMRVIDQPPSLSAVTSSSQSTVPFNVTLWIPCANDGLGENVQLTGEIEIHSHAVEDDNGGMHMSTHMRPAGVVGVGALTGARYRGTGGTFQNEGWASGGFPYVYTYVNNFRIIGQGPGNNLLVHVTVHQTLNADGELTAEVDLSSMECK